MITPHLPLIIGAVIVAVFGWLTLAHARDHVKTHGIHRITYRALTGRRTDGRRFTNASFIRRSNGIVTGHPVGRVSARHHRAGIANLARTLAWGFGLVLAGWGATQNRFATLAGVSAVALVILVWQSVKVIKRLRRWYSGRTVITPLAEALGPVMQLTGPEAEELIRMEPDYLTKKTGVIGRIDVPPRFNATPGEMDQIKHLISSRLPIGADLSSRMAGKTPHILIHAAPSLPSLVKFRDYIPEIEKLGPGKYLPGITRSGDGHIAAFDGEDPHHGYCWGSGRGKSTILKLILATILHNEPDSTATVLDPKEVSLDALKGVPGITFFDYIEDFEGPKIPGITEENYPEMWPQMWDGIKSVYDLMKHRYSLLKADPTIEFPTHLFVIEEANSFSIMSSTWWKKNRPKGMQGATPPIWADYMAPLFWRARQVNIKIVLVAQSIQERFLGNLNLRPSLGQISLSGFKANQWMNYVGTSPVPKAQRGKGRAIYVAGESEVWVQCLYGSDAELKEFAMASRAGRKFPVMGETEPIRPPAARSAPDDVPVITSALPRPWRPGSAA
jgi:hypothetical protein